MKFALIDRGREVGSVAWVPSTFVPYVGAGGGAIGSGSGNKATSWTSSTSRSSQTCSSPAAGHRARMCLVAWTCELQRPPYLTIEARYQWATGDFGPDWINFDPIDLSGFHLRTGINFIF